MVKPRRRRAGANAFFMKQLYLNPSTVENRPLHVLTAAKSAILLMPTVSGNAHDSICRILSESMLPTAQSSVNFVCGEGFRNKITEPLTDVRVTRVISVLKCFEKLSESLRFPAVFGWTTSLTRHANLLKRFVSLQNFFEKKLVLPAVPEVILVQ
jgi:hypothetical protein